VRDEVLARLRPVLLKQRAAWWRSRIRSLARLAGQARLISRLATWRIFAGTRWESGRALVPLTLLRHRASTRLRTVIRRDTRTLERHTAVRRTEALVRSSARAGPRDPDRTEPRNRRQLNGVSGGDHRTQTILRTRVRTRGTRLEARLRPLILRERIERSSTRSERAVERLTSRLERAAAAPSTARRRSPVAPTVVHVDGPAVQPASAGSAAEQAVESAPPAATVGVVPRPPEVTTPPLDELVDMVLHRIERRAIAQRERLGRA
jgi:hypothetical protein